MKNNNKHRDNFRNQLGTVDSLGKRIWIYAQQPKGLLYNRRQLIGYTLVAFLFLAPFIRLNGEPFILFNIIERKFIILGLIFTPQDTHLFALMMIIIMLFVVLFTVVFGRLFCGWVCPQTVFLELIFRRIEYWIEGNPNQQKKLNNGPWNLNKWIKKTSKHIIFFAIAFVIGNVFLSYIIGSDEVLKIITEPIAKHLSGFIAMFGFSMLFYAVFAFMREQVCVAVCPYGRLQSVLIDNNSLAVMYDWVRGEPRGRRKKTTQASIENSNGVANSNLGDCVDCNLCVQVCPTGIDIRNGTQLECVNCTACIDVCNSIMDNFGKDHGLIRIDSYNNIEKGKSKIFNSRVWAYSAVLLLLVFFQSFLLFSRPEAEFIVQRAQGTLFQTDGENNLKNLFNYQVVNKTSQTIDNIEIILDEEFGSIELIGEIQPVEPGMNITGSFFIKIPEELIDSHKTKLKLILRDGETVVDKTNTNFLAPIK